MLNVDLAEVLLKVFTYYRNGVESIIEIASHRTVLTGSSNWWVDNAYTHSGYLVGRCSISYYYSKQGAVRAFVNDDFK